MKKSIILASLLAITSILCGCTGSGKGSDGLEGRNEPYEVSIYEALPVTGTFINLPYQDVRNKYTNPQHLDCTDPDMWAAKVAEMKKMGMECQ